MTLASRIAALKEAVPVLHKRMETNDWKAAPMWELASDSLAELRQAIHLLTALESRLSELEPDVAKERHRREHQGTHGPDCWQWGPAHYPCALERLAGAEAEAQAAYVAHAECPADNDITADQRRAWETYRPYFHARVKAIDAAIRAGKESGK